MADSVFVRVERIIRTSADRALELAERASGVVLMREAARELERAEERLRADREAAERKRERAGAAQAAIREKIAELGDHASYALGKGREDLARAAVARQVDLEKELDDWAAVAAETKLETKAVEEAIEEVSRRRKQMQKELAAIERDEATAEPRAGPESVRSRAAKAMDRADRMFERAMAERSPAGAEPADAARTVADIARDAPR